VNRIMKIFNRIVFAICAAFGLLLVYSLTDSGMRSSYLQIEGEQALLRQDYEYFISVRFYKAEPLIDLQMTKDDNTYNLKIYEVAYISLADSEYVVTDGIFFLMHQTAGSDSYEYFEVILETDTDLAVENLGFQVLDLPLYSAMNQELASPLFKKSSFAVDQTFQNVTGLTINLQDGDPYLQIPLAINWADFTVKTELETYLSSHDQAPDQAFGGVSMAHVVTIDTSKEVIRNIAIYVAAVLVLTVGLFFIRKKKMGRVEPTPGVMRDLERQKESAQKSDQPR